MVKSDHVTHGLITFQRPMKSCQESPDLYSALSQCKSGSKRSARQTNATDVPFFQSVFSRDRFFQIFGNLHAGDIDSNICCQKIQPLLDLLCPKFEVAYTPDQHLAVDESVRVGFLQYLRENPILGVLTL